MPELLSPILKDGLRSPNFFNGRLVSGEDLTTEHDATMERLARLGRAVGSGVAYGLWVKLGPSVDKTAPPVLTVEAGLAVNRCGQTVRLAVTASVTLVRGRRPIEDSVAGGQFSCCVPLKSGGRRTGDGVYVLTIAPAAGREGRAPVNGLSPESARCNSKYLVEGVQFNLIPIDDPFLMDADFNDSNRPFLRNRVAYKCFGVEELAAFPLDPFGADLEEYGLMDKLRDKKALSDCEVPLAIVYWTNANAIEFIDMWAVRRRVAPQSATRLPISDRRRGEGEAMFLQFQEHVGDLLSHGQNLLSIEAGQYFARLPALGFLPLSNSVWRQGFDFLRFFNSLAWRKPVYVEGAKIKSLIESSFRYPPIDATSQELIWLYFVRENQEAGVKAGLSGPRPYLVFVSGYLPYQGDAQFNLSRWSYSNYV
jgi:hypothetical protein